MDNDDNMFIPGPSDPAWRSKHYAHLCDSRQARRLGYAHPPVVYIPKDSPLLCPFCGASVKEDEV